MASSEVNVHVEEVVVVTTPDGASEASVEEVKTVLVATELAQIGEELADGNMESESAATAVLSKEAVIVKLSEEVDVEADVIYPITCGEAKATLIWKKFVCPGINIKCVQFDEHLISPKEFVCLAGKSTLKDWKRAIRLNGTMIRKIMDSGELDFYQHSKVCSNTCRSTKIDLVGTRVSVSSQQSTEFIPVTPTSADLNGSPAMFPTEVADDSTEWVTAIGEDSVTFWRGLKEAGLLEEVVEDFQKEIQEVLSGMEERITQPPLQVKDAVLLNNIVQNFGMLDLVKKVLASHKSQMDHYREQYSRSLVALEQQCDEHRKRAKELKSKSQHLNNVLMNLNPVAAPPAPKRPRLTRAISGPAAITSSPTTQITLPITQLAGLPLGTKVLSMAGTPTGTITPQTAASFLGGYTLLASPGGTAELAPDASNLAVLSTAAAVQEGAGATTFVKVVSPFQLVTLPAALGATLQGLAGTPQGTMVALPVSNNNLATTAVTAMETQVVDAQMEAKSIEAQTVEAHTVEVAPETEVEAKVEQTVEEQE